MADCREGNLHNNGFIVKFVHILVNAENVKNRLKNGLSGEKEI